MSLATKWVSFRGGPLDGLRGELLSLAPIGIDGSPSRGRGVYRELGRNGDESVFEWEPVAPGRRLIEPHLEVRP